MDKYPELDESYSGEVDGDFLKREKELLGDSTEFEGQEEQFEQDFPSVEEHEHEQKKQVPEPEQAAEQAAEPAAEPAAESFSASASSTSQFIQEWQVKHQLEIERRDKASEEKQQEIRTKAQGAIDDFYANYNTKREESVKKVEEDAKKFVAQRDEQNTGSTWDKAAAIIENVGKPAEGIVAADKSRFKELVNSLKGDADAPGAAGY